VRGGACPLTPAPRISATAIRWFARYNRRYLAKHFSRVTVAGLERAVSIVGADERARRAPLIVYLTHAAWWDPLIGVLLATGPFADRHHRAVIDARSLERYALLARLGFVGLDREGPAGARSMLRLVDTLSTVDRATLWLTPQGRFTDPRVRPVVLAGGLAHIAKRLPHAHFLPMAIEYPMAGERLPEARVRFGEPEIVSSLLPGDAAALSKRSTGALQGLTEHFAVRLADVADRLADDVMHDSDDDHVTLLDGAHGVGAWYDVGRRLRARVTGREFDKRHGGNLRTR